MSAPQSPSSGVLTCSHAEPSGARRRVPRATATPPPPGGAGEATEARQDLPLGHMCGPHFRYAASSTQRRPGDETQIWTIDGVPENVEHMIGSTGDMFTRAAQRVVLMRICLRQRSSQRGNKKKTKKMPLILK